MAPSIPPKSPLRSSAAGRRYTPEAERRSLRIRNRDQAAALAAGNSITNNCTTASPNTVASPVDDNSALASPISSDDIAAAAEFLGLDPDTLKQNTLALAQAITVAALRAQAAADPPKVESTLEKVLTKIMAPILLFAIITYFIRRWDAGRSTYKSDEQLEELNKLCSTIADLLNKILSDE